LITAGLAAMLALTVAACESTAAPAPDPPTLAGRWSGFGAGVIWSMNLVQNGGGVIDGVASAGPDSASIPLSVHGVFSDPDFSLVLSSQGYEDLGYAGTLGASGNQMNGTLSGSGFAGDALTFTREP